MQDHMEEAAAILVQTLFSQNSVDLSVRNLMSAKASEGPEAVAAFLGKYWLAMLKELIVREADLGGSGVAALPVPSGPCCVIGSSFAISPSVKLEFPHQP